MQKQDRWFERTFHFDYPVELFPNIVERLRGTPARLEEIVHTLNPELLTRRKGNAWSIQEHAGHLWDLESLWATRIEEFLHGIPVLTPADLENRKTHDANHNPRPLQTILHSFRTDRLVTVDRMEVLTQEDVARTALHPRLAQPMNMLDLAYFVAEHDDHHLAVITSLARMLEATPAGSKVNRVTSTV